MEKAIATLFMIHKPGKIKIIKSINILTTDSELTIKVNPSIVELVVNKHVIKSKIE